MLHNLLRPLLTAASVAVIACASPVCAQPADEQTYVLPAQDLATSLRQVAAQSGRNIIVPSALVAGRQAPAVSGPFTAEGAVRLLLTGSGLSVRRVGDSLVITEETPPGEPSAGAAQGAEQEPIVVTGSHIRGGTPTSQVLVIGRREIDAAGVPSVEELMRKLPRNSFAGVNQENFLVAGADADSTEHGAGVNLRGLGQRATLTLVNGRRIAPSGAGSFVDVSLIPLSGVERVEILTDGASAIYGSDAVGGVVNFIMRRDFEGLETVLDAGTTTDGGGDQLIAGVSGGARWSGGNAMLSYEYRFDGAVEAADRPFTINLRPDTTILPREERHSLFGLVEQEILRGLDLELTGSYAHRDTLRTYFISGSTIPVGTSADADTANLAGTLGYRPGGDWLLQASGGWSRSVTHEMQTQPGGQELVNRFDSRSSLYDFGLQADGSLFSLPGGAVRLAAGADGRHEFHVDVFETRATAARTKSAQRDVRAAFAELNVPLFSSRNRRPGLERLSLTGAIRYEHYDDFGGTWDPQVGMLWSPLPGLTLRGSYGTSFRAPLLSETTGLYNVFYFPAALLAAPGATATGIALATAGTNPDIGPERSRSWTAGVEIEPHFARGLDIRANYYSIHFSGRIALPTQSLAVIGNPAFDPIVTRSPATDRVQALIQGAGRVFDLSGPNFTPGGARPQDVTFIVDNRIGNTGVTTTNGLDVVLRYAFEVGRSRFVADVDANYIFSFDNRLTATAPLISALNRAFEPVDFRARGGLSWSRNGWSANLFVNYADGYSDNRRTIVQRVGSFTTVDAGLSYTFGDDHVRRPRPFRIAFHVENLFDKAPPFLLPDPLSSAGLGYDPVNASGRGRVVSLQLRKDW